MQRSHAFGDFLFHKIVSGNKTQIAQKDIWQLHDAQPDANHVCECSFRCQSSPSQLSIKTK